MQTEEKIKQLQGKYESWLKSQENQTDGYSYELSFVEFCRDFNKELLEMAIGQKSTMGKKSLHEFRNYPSKQIPLPEPF